VGSRRADARVTIGPSRYVLLETGRGDWWVEWELAGVIPSRGF
jgi:hypothetical protein